MSESEFKEKFKTFRVEREQLEYCKQELNKFGYEPLFFQKAGFRPEKFK